MLVGEAGIGKTWIAREVARQATERGFAVLWGCCFEGNWQPAYFPWIEAIGEYARNSTPQQLRNALGTGAPPLVKLIPQLRFALPDTSEAPQLGADEERVRIYDAVIQFLLSVSRETPILIVIDDLQWADRDSLMLLHYLSHFLVRSRIMTIGAYREPEIELDTKRHLEDLLPALRKEFGYRQVTVRGLDLQDVGEFLLRASGRAFPGALVKAIYYETSGNPFYVREVLWHLIEEGKILLREGRWSTDISLSEMSIPEGVRQVVHRRLSRLSVNARLMLRTVAGFTSGFEFSTLLRLSDLSEDALLDCIDEALRAGFLTTARSSPPTYDFAHAIVRHTIYNDLNPDRKARLHRRIASALEEVYRGRENDHAAELAFQYRASANIAGTPRGFHYVLVAADQAKTANAHEREVRFLRMAFDLCPGDDTALWANILCRLALAEANALLLDDAPKTTRKALDALYEADIAPVERAAFLAKVATVLKEGGAASRVWSPLVDDGLALVGDQRDIVWARLTLLREHTEPITNGSITIRRWLGNDPEAVAVARAHGDEDDYALTISPYEWRSRQETDELLALAQGWQRPKAIIRALTIAISDLVERHGDYSEGKKWARELFAIGEQYGSIPAQAEAMFYLATAYSCSSELSLCRQTAQRARDTLDRLGPAHWMSDAHVLGMATAITYYITGDWGTLEAAAANFPLTHESDALICGLAPYAAAAFIQAHTGNASEAHQMITLITPIATRMEARDYWQDAVVDFASTAIWELQLADLAATFYRLALDLIAHGIVFGPIGSQELNAARMAVLMGNWQDANSHFEKARRSLDDSGKRHVRAIADFDQARALEGSAWCIASIGME
jgi:hypothetical protein